ncbi:LPS export ABC transporter periplasmic protein LptC [Silanimonas sp.]|jgi:lipopolysaccharide export system protein LptC|uniref:LPS export ABC transporter periplasmic protein LptC n=1 Tax=Silanimonas sp. TaxID=1929290 RepID=UPI0022CA9D44|nr:LPS export ABC transporter periplasmic protein LptC [Silanimonas sp.]MCZ8114097.1 LPS export ABC transporter periplasmic protein LptC [Silanimonas sp.]
MNRFWLGSLLAIGAAATGTALWWLREPPAPPTIDSRADYRLEGFEMTALRKDGSEGFTVVGPLLERDQDAQVTTLTEPRFGFPGEAPGQRWDARSATAWIGPDNDEVRLEGGVEMLAPQEGDGRQARFSTDHLSVFTESERVRTDAAVTVTQGRSILQATGLDVDMQAKTYELLADVDATFYPEPSGRPAAAAGDSRR